MLFFGIALLILLHYNTYTNTKIVSKTSISKKHKTNSTMVMKFRVYNHYKPKKFINQNEH